MDVLTILLRFLIVFVFAMVFGLERQRSHKPIGFGTYSFVAIGSCALGIVASIINPENQLPILGSIVTGVGFLGAGALIKTSDKVFGFTSAASIWVFSIIGVVVGVGQYLVGLLIYLVVWIVIFIDRRLKFRGIGSYQKKLMIVANKNVKDEELKKALETDKYTVNSLEVNRKDNKIIIHLQFEGTIEDVNRIPHQLFKEEWVDSFKVE
ncbi:MgtC/SapB family protein [archaeon]|nr:MgtC/SapB family protein [archaeon]